MPTAIVSLGSNLGDRAATLDSGLAALHATNGVRVVRRSTWYETSPIGGPEYQEPFLNGAALLETTLPPTALLNVLQHIENEHGRVRETHWGPRTLDLDLLIYDDLVQATSRLVVPHPRLSFRKFVLQGVVEVAPTASHPILHRTFVELQRHLDVAPNYVAFVGMSPGFRSQIAAEAADCAAAKLVEATAADVPAFAELMAPDSSQDATGLRASAAIKFLHARIDAIRASLAEAGDKWIVDDGWIIAEVAELAWRLEEKERAILLSEWKSVCQDADASTFGTTHVGTSLQPKLLASLRTKDELPMISVETLRRASPFEIEFLPTVDLDTSDRERALLEFVAALDASR
ncbi:MAG: 2-amino-4-hydroxy-6-hydroxymethyldihydropteridine diphosphokinase [Planctomycetia bacterium]|nr:2-amino-4-hydroxy-6-hydroxymethyldihydropteridine diphosphokinase [Planctomycetia bacterium]